MKQLSLFKDPRRNTKLWWIRKQKNYGGSLNYRKVERPFDSKQLVHVVFKAQIGQQTWLTRSSKSIQNLIDTVAKKYDVKIKEKSINRDHIHLLIWTNERENLIKFLRLFSAEMGRKYKEIFKSHIEVIVDCFINRNDTILAIVTTSFSSTNIFTMLVN